MRNKLLGCLLSTMLISCSGTQTNTPEQENTSTNLPVEREGVKVMTLTKGAGWTKSRMTCPSIS